MKTKLIPASMLLAVLTLSGCAVDRTYTTAGDYDTTFVECSKAMRPAGFDIAKEDKATGVIEGKAAMGMAYSNSIVVTVAKTKPVTITTKVSPSGMGYLDPANSAPNYSNKEYNTNLRIGIRDLAEVQAPVK